jgi:uncharacterized membrane protein YcaP (DUF421 family)
MPSFSILADGALPLGISLWKTTQPWWEFVIRALLVYGFLLLVLRLTGKRQVGQLAPFDLVLLLVLSNAVQNSMNGGDNTITSGLVLVLTLVGINSLIGWLTYRSKRVELFVEGRPRILVHDGLAIETALAQEQISRHELMAAVRQVGLTDIAQVKVAILEANGRINVIQK